jgi:protein TonB
MYLKKLLLILILFFSEKGFCSDTLYFRLSNPWNTVKDPNGQYLRKCVKENDYYHVWDYNQKNILVTESYYADTTFKTKMFCHKYFDEQDGLLTQSRCYKGGRLDGYWVDYNKKGDTTGYDIYQQGEVIKSWSLHPEEAAKENDSLSRVLEKLISQEKHASFPGGKPGWYKYLSDNLHYPEGMENNHITGQDIIRFTVTPKGKIEDIEVIQALQPLFDKEAVRVVSGSPKWEPAEQGGKKVKSVITQAINF